MFGIGEEPRHEKFQAKQRIIYLVIGLTCLLLVATGLIKSYKNMGVIILDPMLLQWTAFIHTGLGMLFMFLFIAHVGALLLKSHRPMIPSMFSGKISQEYVEKHPPDWVTK